MNLNSFLFIFFTVIVILTGIMNLTKSGRKFLNNINGNPRNSRRNNWFTEENERIENERILQDSERVTRESMEFTANSMHETENHSYHDFF